MSENTIDILKLTAIVIASIFSIAGIATETRNKLTGKLSLWGYIALMGIIITNSFQFVQTYLEQKKVDAEKIKKLEQSAREREEAAQKFETQLMLLNSNIGKTDTSLMQQKEIQDSTKRVLTEMQSSIRLQRNTLVQSRILTTEQKKTIRGIEKTLAPLIPFKINVYFKINADSIKRDDLRSLNKDFKKQIALYYRGYHSGIYVTDYEDYETPAEYSITQESPFYEKFLECFGGNPDLGFEFYKNDNKQLRSLMILSPKSFFVKEKLRENFLIKFSNNMYTICVRNIPCSIFSNDGFKSTFDLEKTTFTINFNTWFEKMMLERVEFKFPPDFSTIKEIEFKKTSNGNHFKKLFDHLNTFVAECDSFKDTYEYKI